jgi:hypothetical protein
MATTLRHIRETFRRLAAPGPTEIVHFHQGPQGHPAPCFDRWCESPRIDM